MTPTSGSSSRYQRVIRVLDDAIGGPDSQIAIHGPVPEGAGLLTVDVWERFGDHVRHVVEEPGPAPGLRTVGWDVTDGDGRSLDAGSFLVRVTADEASESQIVQVTG